MIYFLNPDMSMYELREPVKIAIPTSRYNGRHGVKLVLGYITALSVPAIS